MDSQDPKKNRFPLHCYMKISWMFYENQKLGRLSFYIGIYDMQKRWVWRTVKVKGWNTSSTVLQALHLELIFMLDLILLVYKYNI